MLSLQSSNILQTFTLVLVGVLVFCYRSPIRFWLKHHKYLFSINAISWWNLSPRLSLISLSFEKKFKMRKQSYSILSYAVNSLIKCMTFSALWDRRKVFTINTNKSYAANSSGFKLPLNLLLDIKSPILGNICFQFCITFLWGKCYF